MSTEVETNDQPDTKRGRPHGSKNAPKPKTKRNYAGELAQALARQEGAAKLLRKAKASEQPNVAAALVELALETLEAS